MWPAEAIGPENATCSIDCRSKSGDLCVLRFVFASRSSRRPLRDLSADGALVRPGSLVRPGPQCKMGTDEPAVINKTLSRGSYTLIHLQCICKYSLAFKDPFKHH